MKRQLIGLAATALLATSALAATDGTLGSTSTGTVTITATLPQPQNPTGARISGLQDFNLGTLAPYASDSPAGSLNTRVDSEICIYHSSPTAKISVSDNQAGFGTDLGNASNPASTINYYWYLRNLSAPYSVSGNTITEQNPIEITANRTSQDCSSGGRWQFSIIVYNYAVQSATPGNYTGTLTLTIANQ